MSEYTFTQLRAHYGTGRSYVIRGEGRNRVYGYRKGIQCDAGDIEAHEWCRLVTELINQSGEQLLQQQLREFVKANYWRMDKEELEIYALKLHVCRIFDDPVWVCFIKFNKIYRPEVLESTRLIWIETECCKAPGEIPYIRFLKDQSGGMTCCPHCGRWSYFTVPEETGNLPERNDSNEKAC